MQPAWPRITIPAMEYLNGAGAPHALQHCRRCGVDVQPGRGDGYLVRIQALADPAPPVFTPQDLAHDFRQEIVRLVEALQGLSPQEALEQVYCQRVFWLCGRCYRRWIEDPVGAAGVGPPGET